MNFPTILSRAMRVFCPKFATNFQTGAIAARQTVFDASLEVDSALALNCICNVPWHRAKQGEYFSMHSVNSLLLFTWKLIFGNISYLEIKIEKDNIKYKET